MNDIPTPSADVPRRDVLFAGLWVLCGVTVAVPFARFFTAPALAPQTDGKTPVAEIPLAVAGAGTWQEVTLEFAVRDGWAKGRVQPVHAFLRRDGEAVRVLSATCTHLGCQVLWLEDESVFHCPCHQGRFDAEGIRIAGPPPKDLASLPFEIRDGQVIVSLPGEAGGAPA